MLNLQRSTVNVLLKYRWRTTVDEMLIRLKSNAIRPTAGIIVIGDEVLKAQVKDINSFYACELLYKHGIKVEKISIVRDNLEDIAQELREFCERFNYVFTSGGIGPTHDDVTYEAVALAFNDKLHYHPTLVDIIKNRFNCNPFPSPSYKMAYIPTKSRLKLGINESTGQAFHYPCVTMKNVYIFPGSPAFFKPSFQAVCKQCFAGRKAFASTEIFLNAREESFASALTAVAQECRNVSFGSYPERNRYYKARVTIESEGKEETEAAKRMFCERIPANIVIHYDRVPHVDCLKKYERLIENSQQRSLYDSSFKKFVNYYQRADDVCIYLDGSEESILMIHFARIAVSKLRPSSKTKLHAVYFKSDVSGPKQMKFFRDLCDRYDVEMGSLEYDKIDATCAIKRLIVSKPELRVLLVGKRSNGNGGEVYDNLTELNEDSSVPVRVHYPLIDWSDEDITSFFSSLSLPYFAQET